MTYATFSRVILLQTRRQLEVSLRAKHGLVGKWLDRQKHSISLRPFFIAMSMSIFLLDGTASLNGVNLLCLEMGLHLRIGFQVLPVRRAVRAGPTLRSDTNRAFQCINSASVFRRKRMP